MCRVYTHEEQIGKPLWLTAVTEFYLLNIRDLLGSVTEVLRPIAGLLSDVENGPFSLIIVDSIIGTYFNELALLPV